MDNEKIKELAQSYVDEIFAGDDMTEQENIEAKNDALVMCMAFAGHILETHCIVEKEKVKNFLELSEVHALDAIDTVEFIEDIFGEKLFNDKEK